MKKANILKKNIQRFGSSGIRLVLLNNLNYFWSQRNAIFYKNEIDKINFIFKYVKFIIKSSMILYLNNQTKNKADYNYISINENISKKYSIKTPIENNFFLNKKNKIKLFKSDLQFNINMPLISIPNFFFDLSIKNDFEKSMELNNFCNFPENYKYLMYEEYVKTYNLIKNIFDNT